nr:MAG TPA: hypothetical protein [Microviridae sp.]
MAILFNISVKIVLNVLLNIALILFILRVSNMQCIL